MREIFTFQICTGMTLGFVVSLCCILFYIVKEKCIILYIKPSCSLVIVLLSHYLVES